MTASISSTFAVFVILKPSFDICCYTYVQTMVRAEEDVEEVHLGSAFSDAILDSTWGYFV